MLLVIESLIAAGATLAYFFYTGRNTIKEIESSTRSYSVPLASAFADIAELSYRTKKISRLNALFHEKVDERIMDEAFFVLKNGTIIAHSDPKTAKRLKGNIANDEFYYNLDLILRPVYRKSRDALFTDYHVVSKPVPFTAITLVLLKRFIYPKIDVTGWLASRAVFIKKKPVGTVSFIISKERIYSFIKAQIESSMRVLIASLGVAFFVSLAVSLVVLVRYRSIQKKALGYYSAEYAKHPGGEIHDPEFASDELYDLSDREIKDAIPVADKE
ncbi:MAG: hypothetical protein A2W19_11390 [Spirochaetes bacterium RBG_16_49_21]|nr:MAG: hypothetical protein A2W19_11390 [Spirochaetes bacterium RBG_16_49_21]